MKDELVANSYEKIQFKTKIFDDLVLNRFNKKLIKF